MQERSILVTEMHRLKDVVLALFHHGGAFDIWRFVLKLRRRLLIRKYRIMEELGVVRLRNWCGPR